MNLSDSLHPAGQRGLEVVWSPQAEAQCKATVLYGSLVPRPSPQPLTLHGCGEKKSYEGRGDLGEGRGDLGRGMVQVASACT